MQAVAIVHDLAKEKIATVSQIALAWILHKGNDFVPIPGTKQQKYLEENLNALKIVLTAADIHKLDDAITSNKITGPRYNEQLMKHVDR